MEQNLQIHINMAAMEKVYRILIFKIGQNIVKQKSKNKIKMKRNEMKQ